MIPLIRKSSQNISLIFRTIFKIRNQSELSTCCLRKYQTFSRPFNNVLPKISLKSAPIEIHFKISATLKGCKYCTNASFNRVKNSEEKINDSKATLSIDGEKVKKLFPNPRATLNILSDKLPQKVFTVHYKQNTSIKGSNKKKQIASNDWVASYYFNWPEKKKFESTALSKRKAADKAAYDAIQWLYLSQHIGDKGLPVIKKDEPIRESEKITTSINEDRLADVERIAKMYEAIRNIYHKTHDDAQKKDKWPTESISADSCSDDEGSLSDGESEFGNKFQRKSDMESSANYFTEPTEESLHRRQRHLNRSFEYYDENRISLPIDDYTDKLVSALSETRAVVLCGAAGCGKSTRVPAALVRAAGARARVLVAEPRRVAAAGLAARVADELGEQIGETVGYQVRLDTKHPRASGHALYCTSGVLLKRLQSNPGLEGTTHVILDEAHERDINTDLAQPLLKRALSLNQNLKLIIMSATLNIEVFKRYFDDCPVIEVPGRAYPVDSIYLEDFRSELGLKLDLTMKDNLSDSVKPTLNYEEIAKTIEAIDKKESGGGILVFLPGWAEIKAVKVLLERKFPASQYLILAVHSKLSVSDQSRMLTPAPPFLRKIVLATNIAETSLTIPDVTCVVDVGAARQTRLRAGASSLELGWISRASAKQRLGRAGRVRPGRCYKMYTREREATFSEYTSPEILRVPLEKTVLDCKSYAPEQKAQDFLSQLPEPPAQHTVENAVQDLIDLGALTQPDERLTPLGRMLSTISLHPRLACALAHSAVSGTVGTACRLVTHMATAGDIFLASNERREEIREIKSRYHKTSDHLAIQKIIEECVELETSLDMEQFCSRLGLRKEKILEANALTNLHLDQLSKSGILESEPLWRDLNRNSNVEELTLATVFSGVDSLLISKFQLKTKGKIQKKKVLYTSSGEHAHISTDSVNRHSLDKTRPSELFLHWGGVHSAERRALMPRGTSFLSPVTVLLFTRTAVVKNSAGELTSIHLPRHRITINIPTSQVDLILKLRNMLWESFQYYIERDKTSPEEDSTREFRENLVDLIVNILRENDAK